MQQYLNYSVTKEKTGATSAYLCYDLDSSICSSVCFSISLSISISMSFSLCFSCSFSFGRIGTERLTQPQWIDHFPEVACSSSSWG